MKLALKLMVLLVCAPSSLCAQVAATATGPHKISVSGTLGYSLRYAQVADYYGGSQGTQQRSTVSGNTNYLNNSERFPFALTYGGGYSWTLDGPNYGAGYFNNLLLSQGIVRRGWNVLVSDNVGYRKQAPITGFSGIPGTGEPIGGPVPPSSQSILTLNTSTVNNIVSGEFEHKLNYATILSGGGSSELLRYPDGNGTNSNSQIANAGLTRRLDSRNSLTGKYLFTYYGYPNIVFSFASNTGLFGYQRQWNRKLNTDVSCGPEWIYSSNSTIVPVATRIAANAMVNYKYQRESADLIYKHATNSGGGYLLGGEADSVTANFQREYQRKLTIELTGGYQRTAGLSNNGVTNAKFGAAQVSRRLVRNFTLFASYTATVQSTSSSLPSGALDQFMQVISAGIGYTSRKNHIGN